MIGVHNEVYPGEKIVTVAGLNSRRHPSMTRTPDSISTTLTDILYQHRIKIEAVEVQLQHSDGGDEKAVAKLAFVPFATPEPRLEKFSGGENFSSGSKRHVAR